MKFRSLLIGIRWRFLEIVSIVRFSFGNAKPFANLSAGDMAVPLRLIDIYSQVGTNDARRLTSAAIQEFRRRGVDVKITADSIDLTSMRNDC